VCGGDYLMDDFLLWMIFVALLILIGNQTRERQEKETKGMSKKKKEKYLQDIKDKQWENTKKILFYFGMFILAIVYFVFMFI
jgi:hypothetical protein